MKGILERASLDVQVVEKEVRAATTFGHIESLFRRLFGIIPPVTPDGYKNEGSDYGLKVRGKKAREKINAQCKDILARVTDPAALTPEDRAVLLQYSGRGGLTENSQYEYYTPTHVAEGVWDALKANGFENGNVLDPCCGAGVFSGTKPAGVIVTGNDLDPVGSKVAALLNPQDHISNEPFERVAVNTPDETYDSCVGNVPFGNARGASQHEDPVYKKEKLIERYFLLRVLDKLKPGGLACFVVPANIVGAKGKRWEEFRIALSRKAEFLGAHKLPSKTFAAQGTDTVVDVIVLRKHTRELRSKIEELAIDDLRAASVVWDEFVEGRYWQGEGRPFIMGKYVPKVGGDRWSREVVDGDVDDAGLKRNLARKFHSRINWEALSLAEPVIRAYTDGDRRVINGAMYEMTGGTWQKVIEQEARASLDAEKFGAGSLEELRSVLSSPQGALSLTLDHLFAAYKTYPDTLSPCQREAVEFAISQPRGEYQEQLYRGAVIGGMIARMSSKADAGEDVTQDRAVLQEMVTAEIERFGHPKHNKGLVLAGEGSRMFGMFKNAVDEQGNFSDLLAGTLDKSAAATAYNPSDVHDIVTHLFVREGQEEIRLEDVQALYQGEPRLASLGDLADREGVAITPDGRVMPMNRYCAGNIYEKMAECAQGIAESDDERLKSKFRAQIEEMNRRRTVTKSEDIVFGLRQKWLSHKYVVEFLHENGYRDVEYGTVRNVEQEQYDGSIETVQMFAPDYDNPAGEFRGLESDGFEKQFGKYLNGGKVTSSKAETKAQYVEHVASLEAQFNVWMQQHPDIEELTEQFNRQFNAYVPFEYEGESLGIEDCLSGEITPHSYQNAEVRRLSEQGSGICGFGVGLGKSFTALATAAYNNKRGRAKRTCIVVPSSVLENWYHEARQFYNESYLRKNALFVGLEPKKDKDGIIQRKPVLDENGNPKIGRNGETVMQDIVVFRNSKEDIHDVMWKIPQSNCSLVVMTKEKFSSIPLRPSTKQQYTDEMVERNLMSEKLADKINAGKRTYSDDKAISNIQAKYSDEGTKKTQELPYLEDMGFDSIIVDEAHYFKNSFEAGKDSQGIAYLPTAPSAQIAVDMAIKSHYIRSRSGGRGVYGLTATPVTNSPFEIFNMLSLVAPIEEFERFGVRTVDDFVRVFGKIETVDKVRVSGEVKSQEGLVGFQNLDGLRNLFHKYVTVKTVKDVDGEIHVPAAEEHEENVPISQEQEELYQTLRKRAKEAAKPGPKEAGDSIFSIIRDMDRLTTDIDMFRHTMTFVFPHKDRSAVDSLVQKLPKEWDVTNVDEETGEKFTRNISVHAELKDSGGETFTLVVPETMEETVLMHFKECGIVESEVAHPVTPKYAQLLENLRKHFEANGKQLIFTEEKTQHQKIRRIIVHHLPVTTEQIGIINAEDASGDKLDKISKAYNSGALKIVIANKKAEVGVNLQKGTTAIHHLTLPWTPASINQRNGRGVRQGNKVDSVAIYYYCGKGTFDSYRKDLLQAKSNWINDLLMGNATTMANGDVTGMDELLDMLADNPEEAKRQRAERLAAAKAKKDEAHRLTLVNKLQALASIQHSLDTSDARKEERRKTLQDQLATAERAVMRYEREFGEAAESEKEELSRKLVSANRRKSEARTSLDTLDEKFAAEQAKLENNKKMAVGLLRQAERDGRLPFKAELIDNPGNAVVSTRGDLFCVGDYLEFEKEGVWKVTATDSQNRTIKLLPLTVRSTEKRLEVHKLPKFTKVSYSESELALKKLLTQAWEYGEVRNSGIDKETFLAHRDELKISANSGAVYLYNGRWIARFDPYDDIPEGAAYAWPEPENEDFRKSVCTQFLARQRETPYFPVSLMKKLFGPDFAAIAAEYGRKGTDTEILEEINKAWEEMKLQAGAQDTSQEFDLCVSEYSLLPRLTAPAKKRFDNAQNIERIARDFIAGIRVSLSVKLAEEKAEAERVAQEKLKSDPRYKTIPAELLDQFKELGITVRANTQECYLPGFRGRRGVTHEPFSRWFLQDSKAKMGVLYRMKDILKSRYGASFTSEWSEHSGAWWHVASSVDLKELYQLLA